MRVWLDPADLREAGWADARTGYRDPILWWRFWYRVGWRKGRRQR